MTRVLALAVVTSVLLAPAGISAKGTTTAIELRSPALSAPVGTTDPRVQEFEVWSGPGVNGVAVAEAEGFIANWKAGAVETPANIERYDVLFYTGSCATPGPECPFPILSYVVTYGVDRATQRGYVYIPGEAETFYAINGPTIYRGRDVHGRWFPATAAWDAFAAPLIARAAR